MAQDFDYRPTNNWGEGALPAPWCQGDVVKLVGESVDRLRGMTGPYFVVTYACSIGEGDDWYFRVEDHNGYTGSDRLHVFNGGVDATDWMRPFDLVETRDPEGLAKREQMLADGWSYTPPPTCEACGQRLPKRYANGGRGAGGVNTEHGSDPS